MTNLSSSYGIPAARAVWLSALAVLLTASISGCANAGDFRVSSPGLEVDEQIAERYVLNGFGCKGANVSPEITWKDAPPGTKSFAVTLYDPDAPTGSGWWHWLIFNIPASATGLPEGAGNTAYKLAPAGAIQSRTDFGTSGYGGPCPPAGDRPHRYRFTVYALDVESIPLDASASGAMVGFYLNQNAIGQATLQSLYSH